LFCFGVSEVADLLSQVVRRTVHDAENRSSLFKTRVDCLRVLLRDRAVRAVRVHTRLGLIQHRRVPVAVFLCEFDGEEFAAGVAPGLLRTRSILSRYDAPFISDVRKARCDDDLFCIGDRIDERPLVLVERQQPPLLILLGQRQIGLVHR
jgi:hypothetical protein